MGKGLSFEILSDSHRSSINEMMLISCDMMAEQSGNEKDACIGTVHRAKEKRLYQATIPT